MYEMIIYLIYYDSVLSLRQIKVGFGNFFIMNTVQKKNIWKFRQKTFV